MRSTAALSKFVAKRQEFLDSGVNVLIVDPFPPPDKPLTLAAYVAGDISADLGTVCYVEPVAVGDVLPDMPAYLDPDVYVPVPLEAAYLTAWATCPADMRTLVETGSLPDE